MTADHQPKMWHKDLGQCVLCWLATVDGNGQPNVSPKEIWAVFDDQHLVIAHIASPVSVKNIQLNPKVCVSLIDIFVQKGWKLQGHAHYENASEPKFHTWANQLQAMVGEKFKLQGVIVVKVEQAQPIWAPSYRFYPDSTSEKAQMMAAMKAYGVRPLPFDQTPGGVA